EIRNKSEIFPFLSSVHCRSQRQILYFRKNRIRQSKPFANASSYASERSRRPMTGIKVTLPADPAVWAEPIVTDELAALFSYAHQWALVEKPGEAWTLTFSSMLAAVI